MSQISSKQINGDAIRYARSVLGDHQFRTNKDAVKAIVYDFKAGFKAALERIKSSGSDKQSANFTEN